MVDIAIKEKLDGSFEEMFEKLAAEANDPQRYPDGCGRICVATRNGATAKGRLVDVQFDYIALVEDGDNRTVYVAVDAIDFAYAEAVTPQTLK